MVDGLEWDTNNGHQRSPLVRILVMPKKRVRTWLTE